MHQPGTHVGRFELRELVEDFDELRVFRAEAADTHEAVQLVLLPPQREDSTRTRARRDADGVAGPSASETARARLAAIATHAPLVEAGTDDDVIYLAMPNGAADALVAEVIAALLPPIEPELPPPSTLWVRVRPFVAALLIVVIALIGLHVWDGIEARREAGPVSSTPGHSVEMRFMWGAEGFQA